MVWCCLTCYWINQESGEQPNTLIVILAGDLVGLNNTCCLMARKVLDQLPSYIAERLPSERWDLQLGQHWVFSSFCKHLPQICILMCLQSQITHDLETHGLDEGYLALPSEFQSVFGEKVLWIVPMSLKIQVKAPLFTPELHQLGWRSNSISMCMNISGNPGCESQLDYFGDN
jgi:hypothetical protein